MATQPNGGGLPAKRITPEERLFDLVRRMDKQIALALPRHITPERMVRVFMTAIRETPKLALCDHTTVLASIMELSQLGLEANTPLEHAYLIPYKSTCTVVIGYRGYIALAQRGDCQVEAEAVYEGDDFSYSLGTDAKIHHVPTDDIQNRGQPRYAYAIGRIGRGDRRIFKVVNRADIAEAMASSASSKGSDSPWRTHPAAMWRKTAVRRLAPFLPMTAALANAIAADNSGDRGQAPPAISKIDLSGLTEDVRADLAAQSAARAKAEADAALSGQDAAAEQYIDAPAEETPKPEQAKDQPATLSGLRSPPPLHPFKK
jgi:recombination protein RecT